MQMTMAEGHRRIQSFTSSAVYWKEQMSTRREVPLQGGKTFANEAISA